jgi:hypothetical protein
MILYKYNKCPICEAANRSTSFKQVQYNIGWLEEECIECKFRQYYFTSFKDLELSYLQFTITDFSIYIYSDKHQSLMSGKTVIYHKLFPKGQVTMGPFQVWNNFMPDFNDLDKLNNKLKILRCFQ